MGLLSLRPEKTYRTYRLRLYDGGVEANVWTLQIKTAKQTHCMSMSALGHSQPKSSRSTFALVCFAPKAVKFLRRSE